jgi:hypothetical protein
MGDLIIQEIRDENLFNPAPYWIGQIYLSEFKAVSKLIF